MKRLGWLLPMLVLAACASEPPPAVVAAPRLPGLARGIDLPIDSRDVSNELKGSRLDFVARYYRDPASRWPTLSAAEARMVSSTGMSLVAVWEFHSHKPDYFSYASGCAGKNQVADRNAPRIEAHDERRHCSRRHKRASAVHIANGLSHGLAHVCARMKYQFQQSYVLNGFGFDGLDPGDV